METATGLAGVDPQNPVDQDSQDSQDDVDVDVDVDEDDARRRGRLVWLLTAVMAGIAVALTAPSLLADPRSAVPDLVWFALLPLFALAEVVVIHLPTQRNAHGHTLREIPAVVGLTFLAPQQYVLAYVVGAVAALVIWAHMRGVKLAFNAAMFAFEAALGLLTYHAILQGGDPLTPHGWAAALAAVLVTDLISAAAVTAAISITEGAFDDEVLREALQSGVVAAFMNTCVALIIATLVLVRPSALPLLAVILVLLVAGYRAYVTLARGHARTQLLYRFVDKTAAAGTLDEVVSVVLTEAEELMHAQQAYLVELCQGDDPQQTHLRCRAVVNGQLHSSTLQTGGPPPWWWEALDGRAVLLRSDRSNDDPVDEDTLLVERTAALHADDDPSATLVSVPQSPRDAVAAPLREAGHVKAVLVVCDRSFEKETFGSEDVQIFEALAAHAGIAVERAHTVNDLERLVEERAYDALHDPLSGLLNRRAFNEAVAHAMRDLTGALGPIGCGIVLLLDLDDFKDVNDTLGHSAGDRLITVTADRLREAAAGTVARLGGDEFAVLLPGLGLEEGLDHASQLHALLAQPVPLGDVQLIVSASIGVAQFNPLTESADDLLAQADVAMYTAKADRSGVALYRPEAGDSTARRMTLAADLPGSLEHGDIELWYQPQADAPTGKIRGFEALVRWSHPRFGMIPPPEIIAVAHRTGRMRELTNAVIDQALKARQCWSEAGHDLHVSVNVTPRDVSDHTLVQRVEHALGETGTHASALVLEITESDAMKDPERSIANLEALNRMGVTVSIDDFGTGYSSLAYLDQLPVREVKIDQSFIFRLEQESGDCAIVRATIGLAHDLGLRVVAEGVENELTRTLVRELGVDLFQGYGLARPMPGGDVLGWLTRHDNLVTASALRLVQGGTPSSA